MKITIFGSGYVGLVTGACFADVGNDVMCVDVDPRKVEMLQRGEIPIHEPGLDDLVRRNGESGRLHFTTDLAAGVAHGLFQFIAVGTPPDEDGSADLQHVRAVARSIGQHLDAYRVVVNKSTVPVGTADVVRDTIAACWPNAAGTFRSRWSPTRNFSRKARRSRISCAPTASLSAATITAPPCCYATLYAPFNRNRDRLIEMDVRSAELTKYAANAMLATKISFMNEIANLAERLGADIEKVRVGIGADPRIGYHFIYPGCGYGGSCFPKDVKALEYTARSVHYEAALLQAVEAVNERQKNVLFAKLQRHFGATLRGRTLALWGLAFKPGTDDMREAPSRNLLEALWREGCAVRAYDPAAMTEARRIYGQRPDFELCAKPMDALTGADALVIVTEWSLFRSPDFDAIRRRLKQALIFDGRNLYDPDYMREAGFVYYAIGRGENA